LSGIVFTRAWEDDRLDLAALAIRPGERVLAVAAAGDVPLAIAAAGAAEVVAVDLNVAQLRLTALKIAAASLDADERYRWFEVGRVTDPGGRFREVLRPRLEPEAAEFWDRHIDLFEVDFHRHAGVERSFARLGRLARLLVPGLARRIEASDSPAEQQAWWQSNVRPRLFGPVSHWLARHTPVFAPLAPNRHELRRMREGGYSYAIADRIDGVLGRTLVRRHPWWRPAFSGRVADPGDGAAWLDAEMAAAVADSAGAIRLVQGDLTDVLAGSPPSTFDAVTVSNVPDWLDPAGTMRLTEAISRALRPGGRVLVRSILPDGGLTAHPALALDPMSATLVQQERTALYGRVDLLRRTESD
jgi:S-adenosylmethionine-diacylglycerol 3-amino-3-carboxypropyl transferase